MKPILATKTIQIAVLGALSLGIISVLGQIFFTPTAKRSAPTQTPFPFPDTIELPQWDSVSSHAIGHDQANNEKARNRLISGQVYQYEQGDRPLTIETVYVIDTNGRVNNFLENYTDVPPSLALSSQRVERYREQVGHYILFQDQQSAYLASCINPQGESTVTIEQFNKNRYDYDIRPERLLRWFFRAESIRDFRCLWVNLSTPLPEEGTDDAFATLENVWFFWYAWWQPRFPQP